jgi:molybdenum cofactor cytidylyltransferase
MTGIIILAAGASARLGEPKQQLLYKGKTLLQHAVDAAVESMAQLVIVVLGANAEVIKNDITKHGVTVIHNKDWEEGMASSIRAGIKELQKSSPDIDDAILMLCDQPFVDAALLNSLMLNKHPTSKPIIACAYNNTVGPPALFDKTYFNALLSLNGQEGAKKLLMKYRDKVFTIRFDKGAIDIDTVEDYAKILNWDLWD